MVRCKGHWNVPIENRGNAQQEGTAFHRYIVIIIQWVWVWVCMSVRARLFILEEIPSNVTLF